MSSVLISHSYALPFGRYCKTQVAPENIVALRELCRQRFFVVDMASDFKRKKFFPNMRNFSPTPSANRPSNF